MIETILPATGFADPQRPPPGFEWLDQAMITFAYSRAQVDDVDERIKQLDGAYDLAWDGIRTGELVVFVQQHDGAIVEVPARFWGPYKKFADWPGKGASLGSPIEIGDEFFHVKGATLVNKTNLKSFSEFAGRWPLFKLPAAVRLMLRVCADMNSMTKVEGGFIEKNDVINLIKQHWISELDPIWPDRISKKGTYNNKDKCPAAVSKIAEVLRYPEKWRGGILSAEKTQKIKQQIKVRDARLGENPTSMTIIEDT